MITITPKSLLAVCLLKCISIVIGCIFTSFVLAQSLNPNYFYYYQGQAVERSWSVGDTGNWTKNLENGAARSSTGKVEAKLDNYNGEGDAIRGIWSGKKERAQIALYGNAINIKEFEHQAALAFEIKVNRKPTKPVELSMDCGWPCRGTVQLRETLQGAQKGEWFLLPVPLNCFSTGAENFDLTKINGVFLLATEGKLDVSIANIRLELLPEGEKGCATDGS